MARATMELDFFGLQKEHDHHSSSACKSQFQKFLHRRRSFRGLQGAISKMNPELIKSVIASGLKKAPSQDNLMINQIDYDKEANFSVPSSPKETQTQTLFPTLPLLSPSSARSTTCENNGPETAPLTIFYNGTVSIFNVPHDKAESILKLAVEGISKNVESTVVDIRQKVAKTSSSCSSDQQQKELLETLNGDLPIARTKSLQRFLEKRKERLTCAFPYACYKMKSSLQQ